MSIYRIFRVTEIFLLNRKIKKWLSLPKAVSRSDLNLLETIYLYGSDVYTDKDFLNYRYNDTVPLVLAAQVGCLEVFNYLIEHHANIEAKVSFE